MFRSVISNFHILECETFSKEIFWRKNVHSILVGRHSSDLNENISYSKENTFFFVYSL